MNFKNNGEMMSKKHKRKEMTKPDIAVRNAQEENILERMANAEQSRLLEKLLDSFGKNKPFMYAVEGDFQIVFDMQAKVAWIVHRKYYNADEIRQFLADFKYAGLDGWILPGLDELLAFIRNDSNPVDQFGTWACDCGFVETYDNDWKIDDDTNYGYLICKRQIRDSELDAFMASFDDRQLICAMKNEMFFAFDCNTNAAWIVDMNDIHNKWFVYDHDKAKEKYLAQQQVANFKYFGLDGWSLPSLDELKEFIRNDSNPLIDICKLPSFSDPRTKKIYNFFDQTFLYDGGSVNTGNDSWVVDDSFYGTFVCKKQIRKPDLDKLLAHLDNGQLIYATKEKGCSTHDHFVFDWRTKMAWFVDTDYETTRDEANQYLKKFKFAGLDGWALPSFEELKAFAMNDRNPLRRRKMYPLLYNDNWLCDKGRAFFNFDNDDNEHLSTDSYYEEADGCLIYRRQVHESEQWALLNEIFFKCCDWKPSPEQLMLLEKAANPLPEALPRLDYDICRLPLLKDSDWTDPEKGLWEAWGQPADALERWGIRPRDPLQDVREDYVAIDFGTSSTVVAWRDNNTAKLMRIGARDHAAAPRMGDYENPTVLEFVDLPALLTAWQACAYRPGVRWDAVRCSHEALHNWRNNEADPDITASVLAKIKQWALRGSADAPVRISDQTATAYADMTELELPALTLRNPARGTPLAVSAQDPFDPVELYAWFLGMNINWRQRGIFLRYVMTFPVKYPRAVKDAILASFRRGLQRSLPPALVAQAQPFGQFEVQELASEPAAYAAEALPTLKVPPGQGQATGYAVFDFGGGTTDFDFGYWRLPTEDEEEAGIEAVLQRSHSAGDPFLGGENLLENLAYRTFRHNEKLCREKKIVFTRPLDAQGFAGDELLVDNTRAAMTNTLMLMSGLRPLWETGRLPEASSGVLQLSLLTREGGRAECELAVNPSALLEWLAERLQQGVREFYAALKTAFAGGMPQRVHVLLAGNSSRSRLVASLFGLDGEGKPLKEMGEAKAKADTPNESKDDAEAERLRRAAHDMRAWRDELLGKDAPQFVVHPPLPGDPQDLYRATGKTGVALGLLRLCPGSPIEVLDPAREKAEGESPFAWHVGGVKLGLFRPALPHGAPYGQWQELGVPRRRAFNLYYTQSPQAASGQMPETAPALNRHTLHLSGPDQPGERLYARATGPDTVEICTATSPEAAGHDSPYLETLTLRQK